MNKQITKASLLFASILALGTSFGSVFALSLHDLEKRPSLKIVGSKILHNGKRIIVGIGDIDKIEHIDTIIYATTELTTFDIGDASSVAMVLNTQHEALSTLVDALKHDPELKTLQELILVVWSGSTNAQEVAQTWLMELDTAIYKQDNNYRTLVGANNPNT